MKFQQRLAMLSSAGSLTIVYLLLVSSQGVIQVWNGQPRRHRRSLFIEYEFDQKYWNDDLKPYMCTNSLGEEYLKDEDNSSISTIDLPENTNFKVYSNKQYSLPHLLPVPGEKEKLNVIILPHSHVDAGWLRTIEDYYVIHVKGILNNMVKKLNQYENMTFVWAETVFMSMWWNELDDVVKLQVRRLIGKGQLEIALGGWVMSDEASTHYASIIDQLSEGHQWVLENLHTKPVNSWAIDPFGHSGTMPYLWKQSGMENMVIQRVHQAIKATLAAQKSLEFNWRQYWDKTGSSDILCHIMPYVFYGMQYTCGPDKQICAMYDYGKPKILNEKSTGKIVTDDNIAIQAKYLYEQYKLKAGLYKYNTILVPIGDDFRFDSAEEWDIHYNNYMKLMEYMNSRSEWNVNIQFGTLKDYFGLVRKEEKVKSRLDNSSKFPVLRGDFFPYSDQNYEYWTGYYSTRPFDKQLSRDVGSSLHAADILHTLAYTQCKKWQVPYVNYHDVATQLQEARRNLGLFLHHDAITGTAKPHVVQDYENKLLHAYNMAQDAMSMATQTLLTRCRLDTPKILSAETVRPNYHSPPMKYTIPLHKTSTKVILFNPVAQDRIEFVQIVVDDINIEIRNSENINIPFQINPIFKSTTKIQLSEFEVVFLAELRPFGIETYTLYRVAESHSGYWSTVTTYNSKNIQMTDGQKFEYTNAGSVKSDIYIENEFMKVKFNKKGMLSGIFDRRQGKMSDIHMDFMSYTSAGSGAYLFYPSDEARGFLTSVPQIRVIKGLHIEKIQVVYQHLFHSVSLYDSPTIQGQGLHIHNELDMSVPDMNDKEVIMRIQSDVKNRDGTFFTDQNGYQLIGRRTNPDNRIETNYYPITSMVQLEDMVKRMTVHSGQSHGAASLQQGWLEVMLDRKVMNDDLRGLGEGVTDNKRTVSNFVLQIEYKDSSIPVKNIKVAYPSLVSSIQNEHLQKPIQILFTTVKNDLFNLNFHPVKHTLPCDISILNLRNLVNSDLIYNGTSLILHRKGYSCNYPVIGLQCSVSDRTVNLQTLFPSIFIHDSRETTLTHMYSKRRQPLQKDIEINAMEIKSFRLTM